MKRVPILLAMVALPLWGACPSSAQDVRSKPFALPSPSAPNDASGPARSRSDEENAAARRAITERLRTLQEQLRTVDRSKLGRRSQESAPARRSDLGTSAVADVESREQIVEQIKVEQRNLSDKLNESICGIDDSQDVELYDGTLGVGRDFVDAQQPATGQIQWNASIAQNVGPGGDVGNVTNRRWCTGTLISDRLFLTAGHCFDIHFNDGSGWRTPRRAVGNTLVSLKPPEMAPLMHVNFNYQINAATNAPRVPDVYPIVRLVEHREGERKLDYAVVELGPGADGQLPNARYRILSWDTRLTSIEQATQLTIIQHPNGVPKRIAAGTQHRVENERMYYSDIDTLGGSSGAGVLDQAARLIGVHTNGGCTANGGENFATTINAISQVSAIVK